MPMMGSCSSDALVEERDSEKDRWQQSQPMVCLYDGSKANPWSDWMMYPKRLKVVVGISCLPVTLASLLLP